MESDAQLSRIELSPCGKSDSCSDCPVRHVIDSNLHSLAHAQRKKTLTALSAEFMGVNSQLQKMTKPTHLKVSSVTNNHLASTRCPTVLEDSQAGKNIQAVVSAALRSLDAQVDSAQRLNS